MSPFKVNCENKTFNVLRSISAIYQSPIEQNHNHGFKKTPAFNVKCHSIHPTPSGQLVQILTESGFYSFQPKQIHYTIHCTGNLQNVHKRQRVREVNPANYLQKNLMS